MSLVTTSLSVLLAARDVQVGHHVNLEELLARDPGVTRDKGR